MEKKQLTERILILVVLLLCSWFMVKCIP